jgi:hypothetical protein
MTYFDDECYTTERGDPFAGWPSPPPDWTYEGLQAAWEEDEKRHREHQPEALKTEPANEQSP